MVVLAFIFWLILIIIGLFILLLAQSLRFRLEGKWRESLDFKVLIGIGLLHVEQQPLPGGEQESIIRFGQHTLIRKRHVQAVKAKPAGRKEHSFQDVRPFLQADFLAGIIRTLRDLFGKVGEKELRLTGYWGFEDPCHTGLLAAGLALLPGVEVHPVFNQALRDLEFKAAGRIRIAVVVYCMIKFLVSRESRQVWRAIIKRKKRKKLSLGATTRPKAVYSTVR